MSIYMSKTLDCMHNSQWETININNILETTYNYEYFHLMSAEILGIILISGMTL